MRSCSVTRELQIVRGCLDDYKKLSRYHYRDNCIGPFAAIFVLRPVKTLASHIGTAAVGVIVYTMPSIGLELRNIATGNFFSGFDRSTRLELVNKNVRCISRVIIEPRFRSLGLASRLVRQTMPKLEVSLIEAMAVMGQVNPFFEKAGMTAYAAKLPVRCIQMVEAFSVVGIEEGEFTCPQKVQQKLTALQPNKANFIETQMRCFLSSYGKRRNMSAGLKRTEFVLSKLSSRPVYYIWSNPDRPLLTN